MLRRGRYEETASVEFTFIPSIFGHKRIRNRGSVKIPKTRHACSRHETSMVEICGYFFTVCEMEEQGRIYSWWGAWGPAH